MATNKEGNQVFDNLSAISELNVTREYGNNDQLKEMHYQLFGFAPSDFVFQLTD